MEGVGHRAGEQVVAHLFGDLQGHVLLRFAGRGPQVRGGDEVLRPEQHIFIGRFVDEDVEGGAAYPSLVQEPAQSRFVDQPAASAIDDHHAPACALQSLGRQDIARLVGEWRVKADDVGSFQQLIEFDLFHPDLHRPLGREEGIVGDDPHFQAVRPVGDDGADIAGADQSQGLGVEFHAHETVLLPPARLRRVVRGRKLPRQGEHHGDRVLGRGDRVAEGSVHDHDSGRGGGGDVDVVDADAGPADDLQIAGRGDHILVGLGGRPHGEPIVPSDYLDQFILRQTDLHVGVDPALAEDLDGGRRKLVGDKNPGSHGSLS